MILLALESATDTVGAAVIRDDDGSAERTHVGGRAHAENLAPAIEEACALTGCRITDVDRIAVDLGPGLFTGLRVGVATAKALAQALGIGVLGVGSLDILAAAAWERGDGRAGPVVAVVDARRGEVFAAAYHVGTGVPVGTGGLAARTRDQAGGNTDGHVGGHGPDGGAEPPDPASVRIDRSEPMAPTDLEAWLVDLAMTHPRITVVGDGAIRYRDLLSAHGTLDLGLADELSAPPPLVQARLARRRLAGGASPVPPEDVVPDYRRAADARINWEQRIPEPSIPGEPIPEQSIPGEPIPGQQVRGQRTPRLPGDGTTDGGVEDRAR